MADRDDDTPKHLGRQGDSIYWDWDGEDPVEIVLVVFILVLFFMLPRPDCGVDHNQANFPAEPPADQQPVE